MSGYTGTFDSDGTISLAPPLLGSADYLITKDVGTPSGQTPVVTIAAGGVIGTLEIDATNGAVADVTENLGVATTFVFHANGGTIDLGATGVGALSSTSLLIENGGTATMSGSFLAVLDGSTVAFGAGTGNTLDINSNGSFVNLTFTNPISGFKTGDNVIDSNIDYASVETYQISGGAGDQTITFFGSGGTNLGALTFAPGTFAGGNATYPAGSGPVSFSSATGGALQFDTCFAAGTHILTPNGEVTVERLQVGDLIVTAQGICQPIKWLGHRQVDLRTIRNKDQNYLIRIKAHAFAPHVPHRDLLVTQEHCIFADGGLIPARMLVNERSIAVDRNITSFTYHHVELERHNLIVAEGLATESYLDTGNRGNFANAGQVSLIPSAAINSDHKSWADAAFPLTVDVANVKPVWTRLNERAVDFGFAKLVPDLILTCDPDLRILTGSGAEIRPVRAKGDRFLFVVPADETDLYLASRASRPSDVIGPFIDDRRSLGVLVGEIVVYEGSKKLVCNTHLSQPNLVGWFDTDSPAHRWTNGRACIPLDLFDVRSFKAGLEVQIVSAGPYILGPQIDLASVAA